MRLQVPKGALNNLDAVLKHTNPAITFQAEHPANLARFVAVIDIAHNAVHRNFTDTALMILALNNSLELFHRDAVLPLDIPASVRFSPLRIRPPYFVALTLPSEILFRPSPFIFRTIRILAIRLGFLELCLG